MRLDLNGNIPGASRWREWQPVDSLHNYPNRCKICLIMEFERKPMFKQSCDRSICFICLSPNTYLDLIYRA